MELVTAIVELGLIVLSHSVLVSHLAVEMEFAMPKHVNARRAGLDMIVLLKVARWCPTVPVTVTALRVIVSVSLDGREIFVKLRHLVLKTVITAVCVSKELAIVEVVMEVLLVRQRNVQTSALTMDFAFAQRRSIPGQLWNAFANLVGMDSIVPCPIVQTIVQTMVSATTELASATTNGKEQIAQFTNPLAQIIVPVMVFVRRLLENVYVIKNTMVTRVRSGSIPPMVQLQIPATMTVMEMECAFKRVLVAIHLHPLVANVILELWVLTARVFVIRVAVATAGVFIRNVLVMKDGEVLVVNGKSVFPIVMTMVIVEMVCVCARKGTLERIVVCSLMRQ